MKKYTIRFFSIMLLGAFLLAAASPVSAEDGAIKFSNKAFKQVINKKPDGSVEYDYVEPGLVLPGDVILYEVTFKNVSDKDISNIVINNPIANNSSYRADAATGDNTEITFSVDGKNFSSADALVVKDKTGKSWKAKPEDYTAIRWVYKKVLKPGEQGKVSYKTVIRKTNESR